MNIIAFLNQKGGVGKTTSAVNIGAILAAEHGCRVLAIDLDPQGNLSDHLGVYPEPGEKSLYDVLIDGVPAAEAIRSAHGLDVLPSNPDLAGAETELVSMLSRETRLKKAVGALCPQYDYILLDCPPSLGLLSICGLTLAQSVIVPMEATYLALKGLSQLNTTLELVKENLNPELEMGGVVFCMYSGNSTLARSVKQDVESVFPGKVFETCIRRNVRLAEAPSHGLPINEYDAVCAGADDYRLLAEEIRARYEGGDAKKKIIPETLPPSEPPAVPVDAPLPEKTPAAAPEPSAVLADRPDSARAAMPVAEEENGASEKDDLEKDDTPVPAPAETVETAETPEMLETPDFPDFSDEKPSRAPATAPLGGGTLSYEVNGEELLPDETGAPEATAEEMPGTLPARAVSAMTVRRPGAPSAPTPELPPVWKGDAD